MASSSGSLEQSRNRDTNRVWLVTGCSSGIGREIALAALQAGYRVAVTARKTEAVADIVDRFPDTAVALTLDVTDEAQRIAAMGSCVATFGAVDVLVNNAGYGYLAAIEEGEEAAIRQMFETNFFGALAMVRAVLPGMREKRSGTIISVSSQAGLMANPGTGYYSTTKYAMEALNEVLAKEVAPFNIKVSAIQPGPFRTDWSGRSMQQTAMPIDDYYEHVGSRRAMISDMDGKQPGDPAKAADAVLMLAEIDDPPAQLLLGNSVLDTYRGKLDVIEQSLKRWEGLTRGADFEAN